MKTLLVLARGELNSFYTLDNRSILADMPFKVVFLADRGNARQLKQLDGDFEIDVVRWTDSDELLQIAQNLHREHRFCGVATIDESNVQLAADIRQSLNLPGMHSEQAQWFRDKVKMKQVVQAHQIRVPFFANCSDHEAVELLLKQYRKLVIKPIDGFGSKQVSFVTNRDEWQAWLADNAESLHHYEAEEFIDAPLYHINAYVVNGIARTTVPASYLPGMSNVDFTAGTPFVSVVLEDSDLAQRLVDYSNQVNQALALKNGITHLECFVKDDGEIIFCEIGLRPGGGGIVWMIEAQTGINYSQAVLAIEADAVDALPEPLQRPANVAGLIGFRSNMSGFIAQRAELDDFADEHIRLKQIHVNQGDFKPASAHCTDMLGLLIFDSESNQDFNQNWRRYNQTFQEKLLLNCI
jgi:phosphoribosylaminoimidazole carboxylase (NCAIR synthetase)